MKKFSKILIFALSLVIALSAFAIASSAESSPFLVEGLYRKNWEEAISNSYIEYNEDGTIKRMVPVELLNDYEVSEGENAEITHSVVIMLNGKTLKSETGESLFTVSGKDTTLTIVGPGTISVAGTLAQLDGGALVVDASKTLKIASTAGDNVFVIGGEEKASASVKGSIEFESAGANLFELSRNSELEIADGASIAAKPVESATEAFGIALAGPNSKVNVKDSTLTNNGGYIFGVSDEVPAESPAIINCEKSVLKSISQDFGSIVEAGNGYAKVNIRLCDEVAASGGAFSAADTLTEYEGEGKDKVYKKPTLTVNFTASTYVCEKANDKASLFYGNVTGIVSGSMLDNKLAGAIGIGTRLWDGECGVLIKAGTTLTATFTSDTAAPFTDSDGTVIYFNPNSNTNKNFSLDVIDGEACKIYETYKIDTESLEKPFPNYFIVSNKASFTVENTYSTNFEAKEPGTLPGTPIIPNKTGGYGEMVTAEQTDEESGKKNLFFKFEYDASKKEEYSFPSGQAPEIDLYAGNSKNSKLFNFRYITWDFDITTTNGQYSYATFAFMSRESTSSTSYTGNIAVISGDKLTVTGSKSYNLSTVPYEWTHITMIFDIDNSGAKVVDGVTVYPNMYKAKVHFYVNGNYVASTNMFDGDPSIASGSGLKKTSEFYLDRIRFKLKQGSGTNQNLIIDQDVSTSLCIDNNAVAYYANGYDGELSKVIPTEDGGVYTASSTTLKDIRDAIYNKDYLCPFEKSEDDGSESGAVAIVDGAKYNDMSTALGAISDGSVVYLKQDVAKPFKINSEFTVYTKNENGGNYKFAATSNTHYISEIYEDGVLVGYKAEPASQFVTVYWQMTNMPEETKAPLGTVPVYDGTLPSSYYDYRNGKYMEFLGWSTDINATEPDPEIGKITADDLIKGYKTYYPVIAATKIRVNFFNKFGEKIHDAWYALGETPELLITEGEEDGEGRFFSTVGWSVYEGASVPDSTLKITKNDLVVGDKNLYAVNSVQKVLVDFYDANGSLVETKWVFVGTEEEALTEYNNGSGIPGAPIEISEGVYSTWCVSPFSSWELDGGAESVGTNPTKATPVFSGVAIDNVKQSLTVTRFVRFAPTFYVPTFGSEAGCSFIGYSTTGNKADVIAKLSVALDGVEHFKYDSSNAGQGGLTVDNLASGYTVYLHFTFGGTEYTQAVKLDLNEYFASAIKEAEDAEKTNELKALLETLRLVESYLEYAEAPALAVCSEYLGNSEYTQHLTEFNKVKDLIPEGKINTVNLYGSEDGSIDGILDHITKIEWNFKTNNLTMMANMDVHKKLREGYSATSTDSFMQANAKTRVYVSLTADKDGWNILFSDTSYNGFDALGVVADDTFRFSIWGDVSGVRGEMIKGNAGNGNNTRIFSMAYYLYYLENLDDSSKLGREADLKLSRSIYAAHYALSQCTKLDESSSSVTTIIPMGTIKK